MVPVKRIYSFKSSRKGFMKVSRKHLLWLLRNKSFYKIKQSEEIQENVISASVSSVSSNRSSEQWYHDLSLQQFIAMISTSYNLPHTLVNVMLDYFSHHDFQVGLPRTARTLLKTPKKVDLQIVDRGIYVHYGILNALKWLNISREVRELTINFFIDGLEGTKRTKESVWAILANASEIKSQPFLVGLYCGPTKPKNQDAFLYHLVSEWNEITFLGSTVINGNEVSLKLGIIIADYPARAFICNTKQLGYYSCPCCLVPGEPDKKLSPRDKNHSGQVKFPEKLRIDYNGRNDDDYRNGPFEIFDDKKKEYYRGLTILQEMNGLDGLRSNMPLDPMHCLFLGLIKKMLFAFIKDRAGGTLSANDIQTVLQKRTEAVVKYQPREFNYRLRPISTINHWKSTDYFNFVVFIGLSALQKLSDLDLYKEFYSHYISLMYIIRILWDDKYKEFWNEQLQEKIKLFLVQFKHLYGKKNCTMMVHTLIHFVEEVNRHGALINFSSYKFESYLGILRKWFLHNRGRSIVSIIKRFHEFKSAWKGFEHETFHKNSRFDWKEVHRNINDRSCKSLWFQKTFISTQMKDSVFMTTDNRIVIIKKILPQHENSATLTVAEILHRENVFEEPNASSLLGIYKVNLNSVSNTLYDIVLNALEYKFFISPVFDSHENSFFILSMSKIGSVA